MTQRAPFSPPPPRTRFRPARRQPRTVRSTPRTPHVVRRPLRAPTDPQHYAPSAHHTCTHDAATTPREPRCSGLPGPPPPHTRFRLARPSHRTVRSTQRTQHFARHASRATHFALPLATSHPRNHTAPTRRDAAGSSARRRLALAFGPRADRAAPCATRGARSTLRATLRTQHSARFAPHTRTRPHRDRTARCARTLRTQHVVRRPIRHRPHRSIARRLLITRAHALPRAPRRAAMQWAPTRRRLAFGSESRVDRTAQRAARHARSTWRAFLTHTHTQRSPSATSQRSPSATQPQAPRRAATRRVPQPAAVSRSLPARAPTAPPGAQHANAPHVVRLSLRNRPHRNIARRPLIPRAHTQPERCANRDAASSPARRRLAPASSSRSGRTAQCAAPPHAHFAPHARARHLERHPLTTHTHAQPQCAGAP